MSASWVATYRLQLHAGFPLGAAQEILPYLAELGISHVYLSPCLQAVPGSRHGYDVTDPTIISEDLGGESAWSSFADAARRHKLSILLDIVPNHMSASQFNPWWDHVLGNGPYSRFVDFFDVRMQPSSGFCIHLCSLAKPFGAALQAGELSLEIVQGRPRIKHYENTWPLGPASWGRLLLSNEHSFEELERLSKIERPGSDDKANYERHASRAQDLLAEAVETKRLQSALERAQGDKALFEAVLERQFYMLHHWMLAGELGNYRRFFDVEALIGMRAELFGVMQASHARIEKMISKGDIDGLRVDHPDGLRDPLQYFKRLRALLPEGRIYVEKILDNDERLNASWPIDGTVGYDFLARVNRLWMDDQRIDALTTTYSDFTGHPVDFSKLVREKKRAILETTFAKYHDDLVAAAVKLAQADWHTRDLSPRQLREASKRLIMALTIYRTYRADYPMREEDEHAVTEALQSARLAAPEVDPAAFDFLHALITKPALNEAEADFVAKWQQLTPSVMAKGVEDTTFYCFDRLLSSNEVGSNPVLFGISADKFHEYCHFLSDRWPDSMLATSTHDNKRSEDVRARISVISEIPEQWSQALQRWSQLNAAAWQNRLPDRHAEYLLYQTLIGAWPIDRERTWQYMLKACREAKINTSWHEPNGAYEEKIRCFVAGVYETQEFVASLESFVEPLVLPGRINSLAQTLIKMVAPGVPDFYQGSELWDLSLVDPDNRRPVDFAARSKLMMRARALDAAEVLKEWDCGMPKLWMAARILSLRRERAEDFSAASKYQPLVAQGSHLGKLLAFRRGENLIVIVPRFTKTLAGDWGDTRLPLPSGVYRNHFTGEVVEREVSPATLLEGFPVALLVRELK